VVCDGGGVWWRSRRRLGVARPNQVLVSCFARRACPQLHSQTLHATEYSTTQAPCPWRSTRCPTRGMALRVAFMMWPTTMVSLSPCSVQSAVSVHVIPAPASQLHHPLTHFNLNVNTVSIASAAMAAAAAEEEEGNVSSQSGEGVESWGAD
jgi:hypothetical protein